MFDHTSGEEQFAAEIRKGVQMFDTGLDFVLVETRRSFAHFRFERQGRPRAWVFTVSIDGSAMAWHPRRPPLFFRDLVEFNEGLGEIIRCGYD